MVAAEHKKADRKGLENALKTIAMVGENETVLGTGVFINPNGTLVTNSAMLEEKDLGKIWAELPNGRRYRSPLVICANTAHDFVVLEFNGQGVPAARPGDSNAVGDDQRVLLAWARLHASASAEGVRTTVHHRWTSPSGIELIAFTAQLDRGVLLGENGDLLGIAAAPSLAPRSSGHEKYAVPASIFRSFFVKNDKPTDLAPSAEASAPQKTVCGMLTDYSYNLEQAMSDEAAELSAEKNRQYDLAISYCRDAVRQLRRIAFARSITSPPADLKRAEQQAEASAIAEERGQRFAEAVAHWKEAIAYLKAIAFPAASATESPQSK